MNRANIHKEKQKWQSCSILFHKIVDFQLTFLQMEKILYIVYIKRNNKYKILIFAKFKET